MLLYDTQRKKISELKNTYFKEENLLERNDFQQAIISSWDVFRNKIGLSQSFLIGQEINPHPSVNNAIDLLACNPPDLDSSPGTLTVIELKRDKNKLQLLQALSYAGMVATWNKEILLEKASNGIVSDEIEQIKSSDVTIDFNRVKILLVAESFDPEVILTAQWLHLTYHVEISAFAVKMFKSDDNLYMDIEQRYPLKEVSEMYDERFKRKKIIDPGKQTTWEEVLGKVKFEFAREAFEIFNKEKPNGGDPKWRRFSSFRTNWKGFIWVNIAFRINYLNIYIKVKEELANAEEIFLSQIGPNVEISEWAEGYSIIIKTKDEFENLKEWLEIK